MQNSVCKTSTPGYIIFFCPLASPIRIAVTWSIKSQKVLLSPFGNKKIVWIIFTPLYFWLKEESSCTLPPLKKSIWSNWRSRPRILQGLWSMEKKDKEECVYPFGRKNNLRTVSLQFYQHKAFLSRRNHRATCIPRSRASNKISSSQTFNRTNKDLLCNNLASITASEEIFPMIKNVSREDSCNCFRTVQKDKVGQ